MQIEEALNIIHQLIEQTNAAGMFKKLSELDKVREAEKTIFEYLKANQEQKKEVV
jgi:hypothetical protein